MFINPSDFPFTKDLERAWPQILEEYKSLNAGAFKPWHEKHLYNQDWKVFGLYAFGKKLEKNCALCPTTAGVLEKIPGLMTAGFSILKPGTIIKPHRGYSSSVLRCHLGLLTPEESAIRVAGELRSWRQGECLVFDDTSLHEAWNKSDSDRVVLLLDFLRPGTRMTYAERIRNYILRFLAQR